METRSLFRAVVTTHPIEDERKPTIRQRLGVIRPPVTMLVPIGHDNTEFGRVVLDRMLPTIHRAAVEDNHIGSFISMVQGHGKEDLRPDY
jgi:hypothetical protein